MLEVLQTEDEALHGPCRSTRSWPLTARAGGLTDRRRSLTRPMPEDLGPCAAPADTRKSPESAASTRPRAMKALTGSPTSTTKRLTTASHGPNALVWKRQPCAFPQMQACSQKALLHKVPLSQRLPEPSEDSLQMLGTQREKTSTVKARLTTLSRMVAIAPMAKRNDIVRGLYSAAPSVAHRSSGLEPTSC